MSEYLLLGFLTIMLFRLTIIPAYIPFLIALVLGVITAKLDWKRYGKTYYSEGVNKVLGCYFMNLFWWGNLGCFLFLAINLYGSTSKKEQETISIIEWSSQNGGKGRRGERLPIFTVNYKGTEKEFVFGHEYYADRATYKTISLTTQEGLLGYTTIREKALLFAEDTQ